jgi:hypothetical protein
MAVMPKLDEANLQAICGHPGCDGYRADRAQDRTIFTGV